MHKNVTLFKVSWTSEVLIISMVRDVSDKLNFAYIIKCC